jgi:hypothetical protein
MQTSQYNNLRLSKTYVFFTVHELFILWLESDLQKPVIKIINLNILAVVHCSQSFYGASENSQFIRRSGI